MLYVFNTWVIANLVHPVFLYLFFGGADKIFFGDDQLRFYFLALLFSFIFSLPVLIAAWLLFYLIRRLEIGISSKFFIWISVALVLPLITWFCLLGVFGNWDLQSEDLEIILPSSIAAISSIFIRTNQFFKLFN
jgi:hypothetical protein